MLLAEKPFLQLHVELDEILHLGQTPYGDRRVIHIAGGRFEGRIAGRIIPFRRATRSRRRPASACSCAAKACAMDPPT
jgi:hypothetical protein